MKYVIPASLAAALVIVGCTVTTSDNSGNTADAGADSGTTPATDSGTTDTDAATDTDASPGSDAGSDAATTPQEIDEVVGNDALDKAQSVPVGSTVKATMTDAEEDFFSFTIPAGAHDGVVRFTLDEAAESFTSRITLYKDSKAEVQTFYAADGTARPLNAEFNATAGKLYYAKVSNGPSGESVPYTLNIAFTPVEDAAERNDTFETAKAGTLGAPFNLYMFAGLDTNEGADVDFFTLTVPAGKTKLRVKIENKATAEKPQTFRATVFDKNKVEGNTAYGAGGQANMDEAIDLPAESDTIYVKFHETESSPIASPVTLSFE